MDTHRTFGTSLKTHTHNTPHDASTPASRRVARRHSKDPKKKITTCRMIALNATIATRATPKVRKTQQREGTTRRTTRRVGGKRAAGSAGFYFSLDDDDDDDVDDGGASPS